MSVSGNYPNPVWVNGYQCWNCTDVDNAKKHIDPAHPKSGPFNVDASTDPTRTFSPAVTLGGALAGASSSPSPTSGGGSSSQGLTPGLAAPAQGQASNTLDLTV